MRKPKLTYKMVEQAIEMKSHGMSNADICRGLGVSETAWYKWLKDPDSKVKVALVEGGWYRKSVPNDDVWRMACIPLNRGEERSSSTSSTASRPRQPYGSSDTPAAHSW